MTSVVANSGSGLQKRIPKERKNQSNSKTNCVVNNSTANESNQTNHTTDKLKSDSKLQPTAEQIRIANLMNDKMDDNELKAKIEQIVELTGSSRDDAVVALHDCDNDTAKAIDMILEGESGADSQWRSTGKKKKPPKSAAQTSDDNSKIDSNRDSKTDRESKSNANKSEKVNNRVGGRGGGPPRLQRAALANRGQRKPRELNRTSGDKNETEDQNNDIFSSSAQQPTFKSSDPSAPPRRGDRRGRGRGGTGRGGNRGAFSGSAGRGSRTFQNRGLQSNDGFPNSIDTWTNSTADQTSNKTMLSSDCNTMTVGNWSDIVANEDWSEEDWEPNHMETKVFTPSTKISEKEEVDVRDSLSSKLNSSKTQNLSQFMAKSSVESNQPTMSSLLSANISRNANVTNVAGQTLLQQIQQSSAGQTPTLNQYSLSYNKEATESIKSLVGLTSSATFNSSNSDLLSTNEQDLDSLTNAQTSSLSNKGSRLKQSRISKIPESAVEMPSNDTIAALGVHFGTLEFGSESNQFSLGNDNSVFQDSVNHVTKTTKPESNSLSGGSMLSQNSENTYRPSTTYINDSTNKIVSNSMIQNSVLGHQSLTSDSLLDRNTKSNVGQFAHKVMDRNNKSTDYSVSAQQSANANDIGSTYKNTYSSDTPYNSNNYSTPSTTGYPYSSSSQSGYGNQGVTNYSTNFPGSTIGNHSNPSNQKLRDIDSQHKPYEHVSNTMVTNTVGSLGLISNSTVTTNVLKNTLSATGKGVHSVPPGVAATPVLSTPYIVQNTGVPLYPMGIPYDLQFQTTGREHNFGPYGAQDVKYGRGSDSDVIPVSSTQTSQTHNQTFVNTFPPGYGFYALAPGMNMIPAQSIYPTAGPIYPVAQPQNAGSAGSAFGKGNTSYGSHSYNSGYDSLSGVNQTQDYVKQSYPQSMQPHNKGSNASDLTSNNSSLYGKTHSQINKSYDKQSFQTAAPAFNMNAGTQSGALSSTYGTSYVLPHSQQAILSMSSLQTDVSQNSGTGVGQRNMSQPHKSSGTGTGSYPKYNWN